MTANASWVEWEVDGEGGWKVTVVELRDHSEGGHNDCRISCEQAGLDGRALRWLVAVC